MGCNYGYQSCPDAFNNAISDSVYAAKNAVSGFSNTINSDISAVKSVISNTETTLTGVVHTAQTGTTIANNLPVIGLAALAAVLFLE